MWSVKNIIFWISVLYETANVDGGYSYPNPSAPSNHPHVYHTYQEVHHEQFVPSVSYSLSQDDYNYLRGQKNPHLNNVNHHQSYNDYNQNLQQQQPQYGQVQPGYNQHADIHQEHQSVHYEYAQHQHPAYNQYTQHHQYNDQSQNHQPTYEQHTQVYDQPVYNQHVQQHDSANQEYSSTYHPAQFNEHSAVIKKYIYFHLPPPDLEKPQHQIVQNVSPPKKTYKIIFIKVPAQESKNHVLLQRLNNIQNHVEEKTLIYVLVKKPEVSTVVVPNVPPTAQSKPEVFYVKYKQNPAEQIASQVNVGLAGDLANSVSGLLPGLVNGQSVISH